MQSPRAEDQPTVATPANRLRDESETSATVLSDDAVSSGADRTGARDEPFTAPAIDGYEIERRMGAGGMGEVFLARDLTLGRHVAIKTISASGSSNEDSRARFSREARSMAAIEHANIARLYSFGALEDGSQYLVMEYVDGINLRDKIRGEGKLQIDEALSITRQVVLALGAAWEKNIVHRDIKPANILIDRKNRVRVVDFGLAKAAEFESSDEQEETLTREGFLLGTPHYISPEQANCFPLDFGTDVYSLGIVLFEMLAGRRPFQGPTPLAVVSQHLGAPLPAVFQSRGALEDGVEELVRKMTAKNREDRPSYAEILARIDELIGPPSWDSSSGISIAARPRPRWSRWQKVAGSLVVSLGFLFSAWILLLMAVRWIWTSYVFPRFFYVILVGVGFLLIAGGSFWAGFRYVSWIRSLRKKPSRILLSIAPLVLAGLVVLVATIPGYFNALAEDQVDRGPLLSFGPYPDAEKLEVLRNEGYTGVISLLHPALFPIETILLNREERKAEELGLAFASVPMLPWVSDNTDQMKEVEKVLQERPGRYYVHAWVDRDRVDRASELVEAREERAASAETFFQPPSMQLERGSVMILDNGKYLIPFPTQDELTTFYLAGRVREVVNLLDPTVESNVTLNEGERLFLEENGIPVHSFPLGTLGGDPALAVEAAKYVKAARPPVAVHSFRVPVDGGDAASEAFLQAYRSGRPPLPPSLFQGTLERGSVEVIAPNIAIGPRPTGPEFGSYLTRRGIKRFVFVGDPSLEDALEDGRLTGEYSLDWRVIDPDRQALLPLLKIGGPFYLYGPELERVVDTVRERYGPAMP